MSPVSAPPRRRVKVAIDLVHEHGGRVFLDLKWHAVAERGGADGLVTSGHEAAALHARWPHFNLVVPGVRPRWLTAAGTAPTDDQRRIAAPGDILAAGASHVVIARPIITHPDPTQAVHLTAEEVAAER